MQRIIEAFTRAHDQVTMMDNIVMAMVLVPALIVIALLIGWALSKIDP